MAARDDNREMPLRSWKEIASFFGKDQRTAKRWEAARGLPVHRVPGGNRASVYAYPSELEDWLRRSKASGEGAAQEAVADGPSDSDGVPHPAELSPPPRSMVSRRRLMLGGSAAALLLAGPLAYRLLPDTPRAPAGRETLSSDPAARDLYLAANYQLALRTASGLRRAAHLYTRSIANDPRFAAAHAGLAKAYALLVEYRILPCDEGYSASREAARKALELDPRQSAAYAVLGLAAFHEGRDFPTSRMLLERALQLDPDSAETLHWLAVTTVLTGEFDLAMKWIMQAQELDPESRAILASKGQILYRTGKLEQAARLLTQFAQTDPDYATPHFYLADIYLEQGRFGDAIRHGLEAARLVDNSAMRQVYEAARAGYRRGGQTGLLMAMLEAQIELHRAGKVAAYKVARTMARLDRLDDAISYLQAAVTAMEPDTLFLKVDPAFMMLREDPRFFDLLVKSGHTSAYPSLVSVDASLTPVTEVPH